MAEKIRYNTSKQKNTVLNNGDYGLKIQVYNYLIAVTGYIWAYKYLDKIACRNLKLLSYKFDSSTQPR